MRDGLHLSTAPELPTLDLLSTLLPSGRCGTTIEWTHIVTRPETTDGGTMMRTEHPLFDQLTNHAHEPRMRARCSRSNHLQAKFLAQFACLCVEIVDNFHVVGDEPYRHNNHRLRALHMNGA